MLKWPKLPVSTVCCYTKSAVSREWPATIVWLPSANCIEGLNPEGVARALYAGISRARTTLILIGARESLTKLQDRYKQHSKCFENIALLELPCTEVVEGFQEIRSPVIQIHSALGDFSLREGDNITEEMIEDILRMTRGYSENFGLSGAKDEKK